MYFIFPITLFGADFNIFHPDRFGVLFVGIHQDRDQIGGTGLGGGVNILTKYQIYPKQFITMGTGIGTVTDGIFKMKNTEKILLPSFEIKIGNQFVDDKPLIPFLYGGVHLFASMTKIRTDEGKRTGERFFDGGLFFGFGLETPINLQWSIYFSLDYRYILTSSTGPIPQFWIGQLGFLF